MATKDTAQPGSGITRRDFLKTSAAATVVAGCGLEFAYDPAKAAAYSTGDYNLSTTTCPYCSASCGQVIVVPKSGPNAGKVVDIYGDAASPMNSGGLCAKGAGGLQLATNPRRVGAWTGTHPVNSVFAADGTTDGKAYKRIGNGAWSAMDLQDAFDEIAAGMTTARGAVDPTGTCNSKSVAFFGSSHMNNEPNNLYRKIIANFGTSNVEHQARI